MHSMHSQKINKTSVLYLLSDAGSACLSGNSCIMYSQLCQNEKTQAQRLNFSRGTHTSSQQSLCWSNSVFFSLKKKVYLFIFFKKRKQPHEPQPFPFMPLLFNLVGLQKNNKIKHLHKVSFNMTQRNKIELGCKARRFIKSPTYYYYY